jgi:hypothetical protein
MAPRTLLPCLAALVLALAGCGGEEEAGDGSASGGTAPATQLTVRVDPDGDGPQPAKEARITCHTGGGDRGCEAAQRLRPEHFEPTPSDVACTELYGGPEIATIEGTLQRETVSGRFSRQDGCEIARWEKVADVLGAAGR